MDVKNFNNISSPKIVLSKYDLFRHTCLPQNFSIPTSIIEYIWLNPKNAKTYLKTIKSCKLLFLKNPILIIPIIHTASERCWGVNRENSFNQMENVNNGLHEINLNKIECKIWTINILRFFRSSKNIASNLIEKVFRCDISILQLETQNITFNQFKFLIASLINEITFYSVIVKRENDEIVLINELIENLSNVRIFSYWFPDSHPILSSENTKKFAYYCCTNLFRKLSLYNIFEGFEIEKFFYCLKENKNRTFIFLDFQNDISEVYQHRIYAIIDEIIATKNFDYLPPKISFTDMDFERSFQLSETVDKNINLFIKND